MWEGIGLYVRYLLASYRGQMAYRASFAMQAVGDLVLSTGEFLMIWALFARFGSLLGWRLEEIALFYGLVNSAFILAESLGRGFDNFSRLVRSGDFDRILLRPRSAVLQIAGNELRLMRVGRLLQSGGILIWALWRLGVGRAPWQLALLFATLAGGSCLFYGLLILQATLCFWTIESLEVMNTLTYGGVETGQYPLSIYRRAFRAFFIFVVPLAAVTYFPAIALLGRDDPLGTPRWFQTVSPVLGVVFLMASLQVWRIGVRHYRSTGS